MTLVCGDRRSDWTFEAVLDQAALTILATPHPIEAKSRAAQFFGKIRPELGIFARSALMFVVIALALLIVEFRSALSRPYARPGEDRDAFIAELIRACEEKNPELSEDAHRRYCTCFANKVADAINYGELDALDSKSSILGSASELRASFDEKGKAAAAECGVKILGP